MHALIEVVGRDVCRETGDLPQLWKGTRGLSLNVRGCIKSLDTQYQTLVGSLVTRVNIIEQGMAVMGYVCTLKSGGPTRVGCLASYSKEKYSL